jgi:hypothetical protein
MDLEVMKRREGKGNLGIVYGSGEDANLEELAEERGMRRALAEMNVHFVDDIFVLHS